MADVQKSFVSTLHEYCAKKKLPIPTFEYIMMSDNTFACRVELGDKTAEGIGRSKRDAKHLAAGKLIEKMQQMEKDPTLDEIPTVPLVELPTGDMVMILRDYCVQHELPLPVFEMVQQSGTSDAPQFVVRCSVASIKRYGVSEKKKDARQLAAATMYQLIAEVRYQHDKEMQVQNMNSKMNSLEEERYKLFKTYRELSENSVKELPLIKLSERHNYFLRFHDYLKDAARKVLKTDYESSEAKVNELFKTLRIKPRTTKESAKGITGEQMVFVDLNCDFDVLFINLESKIYPDIISYFEDMLY